jgi:hypothetical protein
MVSGLLFTWWVHTSYFISVIDGQKPLLKLFMACLYRVLWRLQVAGLKAVLLCRAAYLCSLKCFPLLKARAIMGTSAPRLVLEAVTTPLALPPMRFTRA